MKNRILVVTSAVSAALIAPSSLTPAAIGATASTPLPTDNVELLSDDGELTLLQKNTELTSIDVSTDGSRYFADSIGGTPVAVFATDEDPELKLPAILSVSAKNVVHLYWQDIEGRTDPWALYRDGEVVSGARPHQSSPGTYTTWVSEKNPDDHDYELRTTSTVRYELAVPNTEDAEVEETDEVMPGDDPLPQPEADEGADVPVSDYTDEQDEEIPNQETGDVILGVTPAALTAASPMAAQTYVEAQKATRSSSATLRYSTFIPQKRINAYGCTIKGSVFNGNNRTWGVTKTDSKTRFDARVSFSGSKAKVKKSTYVGSTKLYTKAGKHKGTRTASAKNMKINGVSAKKNDISFALFHSVGNPWCPPAAGSIYYTAKVKMSAYGSWSITGAHRDFPNHEIYRKYGSTWKTVYRKTGKSKYCLVRGVCKSASIKKNGKR